MESYKRKKRNKRKLVYIDMDGVLVDFKSALKKVDKEVLIKYKDKEDEIHRLFSLMKPMPGAIKSFHLLAKHFEIYILSTAPWENTSAWSDKASWVKKYLREGGYKRLIISHRKDLNKGDYIIDDRTKHGVLQFKGEHIHFGQKGYETWDKVVKYLFKKENIKNHGNAN